jgi:hypothetical protein
MLNDRDLDNLSQMIDLKAQKVGKELELRNEKKQVYDGIKKFKDNQDGKLFD